MKNLIDPKLDSRFKLIIDPLAPLSMVSVLPGSYYRSVRRPTKHMICGMLENMLNIHYDEMLRSRFLKEMAKYLNKISNYKFEEKECVSSSGFTSILYPLLNIELEFLPATIAYDDLWTQHLKHNDKRHVDGVRNEDSKLYAKIKPIWDEYQSKLVKVHEKDKKKKIKDEYSKKIEEAKIKELKKGHYPNFYQSPKRREFIVVNGNSQAMGVNYQYKVSTNEQLLRKIEEAAQENNIAYFGTSEGWVHVEIERL